MTYYDSQTGRFYDQETESNVQFCLNRRVFGGNILDIFTRNAIKVVMAILVYLLFTTTLPFLDAHHPGLSRAMGVFWYSMLASLVYNYVMTAYRDPGVIRKKSTQHINPWRYILQ